MSRRDFFRWAVGGVAAALGIQALPTKPRCIEVSTNWIMTGVCKVKPWQPEKDWLALDAEIMRLASKQLKLWQVEEVTTLGEA